MQAEDWRSNDTRIFGAYCTWHDVLFIHYVISANFYYFSNTILKDVRLMGNDIKKAHSYNDFGWSRVCRLISKTFN